MLNAEIISESLIIILSNLEIIKLVNLLYPVEHNKIVFVFVLVKYL